MAACESVNSYHWTSVESSRFIPVQEETCVMVPRLIGAAMSVLDWAALTVSSLVVASWATLPSASVAVACTSYTPSASECGTCASRRCR